MPRNIPSRILNYVLLGLFFFAVNCAAQEPPPPASRVVDLKAADGTNLKATYFAAGKPGPGVLLLHQCNMQRKAWDGLATKLAAAGLNVLTLDFRGFGESAGVAAYDLPPEQNARMLADVWPGDVDTAFRYLLAQPGVSHEFIGAGGASCGVNQSVQLARRHPEVKSLVLLSEATDHAGRQFLRNSPNLPLLLAVADDDDDPGVVDFMKWIANLSPNSSTKLIHYTDGGHGVAMFKAHQDLPATIVDWFVITLKNSPATAAVHATAPQTNQAHFLDLIDEPGGIVKATEMYTDERKRDPNAALFSEALVNRLGYERLDSGDKQGAIQILQLNVTAFPNSANAYDSLSDAFLAAGQKDLARQNAKKALELIPSDTTDSVERRNGIKANAEQKLKQ